jgi:pyrroloquinoline quinone biosynthesis protein E
VILKAREEAEHATQTIEQLAFRNERNSRLIVKNG